MNYNFSPGPSMLPHLVKEWIQEEFLNYKGSGFSIAEMSHRGEEFEAIAAESERNLRELLNIPNNYHVLFIPGGATGQFAMVPMNLLGEKTSADYVCTGLWSQKAVQEAERFCKVNLAASTLETGHINIPDFDTWHTDENAAYLYYTSNETISGVEFRWIPEVNVPLVCDMSSAILSHPVDVARYGVIFACAQKNVGIAGVTIVIIRDDLVGNAPPNIPTMFDYDIHLKSNSIYNTPPTFPWYVCNLIFRWVKLQGGVEAMEKINQLKADKMYSLIDSTNFYTNDVALNCRSRMNVPFYLPTAELDKLFLTEAEKIGLLYLAGHRSQRGMRASIYNGMPLEGVETLVDFMKEFERTWG